MNIFDERARQWRLFGPPARPSQGEVAEYGRILNGLGPLPPEGGILGCTPELRDLFHKHGILAHCMDRSRVAFEALGALKQLNGPEVFHESDWRKMPAASQRLPLVLADGALNMLGRSDRLSAIRSLAERMEPGGHLITRVHLAGPRRFDEVAEILRFHRVRNPHVSFFSAIRTDLDMLWMDPDSGIVDLAECGARLRLLRTEGLLTRKEWDEIGPVAALNRIQLHYEFAAAMKEMLDPYFELVAVEAAADYPRADDHPVWHLKAR